MNLPNAITSVRILLVPVYAWLHLSDRAVSAMVVFTVAAVSDGLDGFLARVLDQRTRLGAILDPIADKFLTATALVLLVLSQTVPAWLLATALARDLIVVSVGLSSKLLGRWVEASPTRISKYATFFLMGAIFLALADRAQIFGDAVVPFLRVIAILAAECLVVAAVQYLFRMRSLLWR